MPYLLTGLAYVATFAVVGVVAFFLVMLLAGPHSGMLPDGLKLVVILLGWISVLVLPVLAALYFLKLKRPQLEVPSLVLWRRVLDDQRVNSPFQRFKRNLLLLVQLLLLAALAASYNLPVIPHTNVQHKLHVQLAAATPGCSCTSTRMGKCGSAGTA